MGEGREAKGVLSRLKSRLKEREDPREVWVRKIGQAKFVRTKRAEIKLFIGRSAQKVPLIIDHTKKGHRKGESL